MPAPTNTADTKDTTFPLDHVHDIEIDAEHMDLTVKGDAALSDQLVLEGAAGESAPRLILEDTTLRLVQTGAHQPEGDRRPILRVPSKACPPFSGKLKHGDIAFRDVNADISLEHGAGGLRVTGGAGTTNVNSGSGGVKVADRDGPIQLNSGSGGADLTRCTGPILVKQGSGGVRVVECANELAVTAGSGGVTIDRPNAQDVNVTAGSGGVRINGGSLTGLRVLAGSGSVQCTAQLGVWERRDSALYTVEAGAGDVSFDLPSDLPVRVEVVVKEGQVVSDVPLVSVGRPGPRGSARRYVGVANAGAGADADHKRRVDLRINAGVGRVALRLPGSTRTVTHSPAEKPADDQSRDDEVRAILDALECKEISVDDAEALLDRVQ